MEFHLSLVYIYCSYINPNIIPDTFIIQNATKYHTNFIYIVRIFFPNIIQDKFISQNATKYHTNFIYIIHIFIQL